MYEGGLEGSWSRDLRLKNMKSWVSNLKLFKPWHPEMRKKNSRILKSWVPIKVLPPHVIASFISLLGECENLKKIRLWCCTSCTVNRCTKLNTFLNSFLVYYTFINICFNSCVDPYYKKVFHFLISYCF